MNGIEQAMNEARAAWRRFRKQKRVYDDAVKGGESYYYVESARGNLEAALHDYEKAWTLVDEAQKKTAPTGNASGAVTFYESCMNTAANRIAELEFALENVTTDRDMLHRKLTKALADLEEARQEIRIYEANSDFHPD